MKTDGNNVSRAQREVWQWKDAVYQDTQHLSTAEALEYILKQGGEIARRLNLPVAAFPTLGSPAAKVAETPAKYGAKRKQERG